MRNRMNALVEDWGLGSVAAVIAVSNSLAEYGLKHGVSRQRMVVVPNGVPTVLVASYRRVESLAARHGANGSSVITGSCQLGCVALFRPRKGLEVLLEALAQLRHDGRDVTLRAVGSFETPEYEQAIHEQAARLGVSHLIEWIGFSSDVPSEMAKMDLFVLPSLFGEGMPMVVLEAMAAGLPIVASRVEGVPQVIRHGADGLLAKAGDARDLAGQIGRILDGEFDGPRWATRHAPGRPNCFPIAAWLGPRPECTNAWAWFPLPARRATQPVDRDLVHASRRRKFGLVEIQFNSLDHDLHRQETSP